MSYTAWFGKVYRTIFQSKRRRLVFKTGVIIYIQNYNYKNKSKIFLRINLHIFIFIIKLKHNICIFCLLNSIDRYTDETAFAATFGWIEFYVALELEGSGTLFWITLYFKCLKMRHKKVFQTILINTQIRVEKCVRLNPLFGQNFVGMSVNTNFSIFFLLPHSLVT